MRAFCRPVLVLVAGLLPLLLPISSALPADEKPSEESDPLGLVLDRRAGMQLQAAADYIKDEDWKSAVRLLQHLLDDKPYTLARLAGRDGKAARYVCAGAEAERLLAVMPEAGRQVYQQTFGPAAAELLGQTRKDRDTGAGWLPMVVRRYLYTDAGPTALQELARQYYKTGRLSLAARCYARLLDHLGPARWSSDDLYQATVAFHHRDTPALAERTLQQLLARGQQNIVQLGERKFTPEELRREIARALPPRPVADWPVYRGDAARAAQGTGGSPILAAIWRRRMHKADREFERAFEPFSRGEKDSLAYKKREEAEKALGKLNQPIIPAFSPITVTISRGEKKTPLVIYKNYWGVIARNLQNGQIAWASPSSWSLERMLSSHAESRKQQAMTEWLNFYRSQYPQILFENSTVGTLSTDGQYVYAVEDLAVPPPPPMVNPGMNNVQTFSQEIQDAIQHSRLQAFDLKVNGKLIWELGNLEEKTPLAECYFLGPPLPLDGLLYLLVERRQQVCLVCLDPTATGKVVSIQPLARTQRPLRDDPYRRIQAAHMAYADGILVCPTNAGLVFGVDVLTNGVAWVHPYAGDKGEALPAPRQGVGSKPNAAFLSRVVVQGSPPSWRGWKMSGPESRTVSDAAAPPARDPADLPPGWVVGPDGRPVPAMVLPSPVDSLPPRLQQRGLPPGAIVGPGGRLIQPAPRLDGWKASAPVLAEGKGVLTPPDVPVILCLNLRDGSLVWSHPKQHDDLYLGAIVRGTVVIVGKTSVRGLNLDRGQTQWTLETGLPSGQGVVADGLFYLPLKAARATKRPEVCVLDVNKGRVVSHLASRQRTPDESDLDVPGNLVFADGDVISLTLWEIAVYPKLKVRLAQIDARLAKDPGDPLALTERAALRRDNGDLPGAALDLRHALKNTLGANARRRIRTLLFDTLTELIRRDGQASEELLKEYKELSETDPGGATDEEQARRREEEQLRRRVEYHLTVARLRQMQGRMGDALQAYLDLAALGPREALMSSPDDPALRVRRDVWVRGRFVELSGRATPEQRKQLEDAMRRRLKEPQERKDVPGLRDALALFGDDTAAGREARLTLAELLMGQREFIEAETHLQRVRRQRDDPAQAARAVEMLARLMMMHGLMPDTIHYYRILRRDFGTVKLPNGRTGQEVWDGLSTDKRLLPFLDEADPFADLKLKARKEEGQFPRTDPVFEYEHAGEDVPFFRRHRVGMSIQRNELRLIDRATGQEQWNQQVPSTSMAALVARAGPKVVPRFRYHALGHLLVMPVDHLVLVVDPVKRRILWEKDTASVSPRTTLLMTEKDGTTQVHYADGWVQYLGHDLLVRPAALCLTTHDGLEALDPLTGRLLWRRTDLAGRVRIFGDDEFVFAVRENAGGEVESTRVVRLTDGRIVTAPDFASLFGRRVQLLGRTILLSEKDDNSVTLRLYDIATGADVWKQSYRAGAIVLRSEVPHLTGAVEPDGKVHLVDLRSRKEVMTARLVEPKEHLKDVTVIHLLADTRRFYLALHASPIGPAVPTVMSNLAPDSGLRDLPVNSTLFAFGRKTGKMLWHQSVKGQRLVLGEFRDLPVLFLTARQSPQFRKIDVGGLKEVAPASVLSIEKGSGRVLFAMDEIKANGSFYAVRVDSRAGTIDFVSPTVKIRHYSTDAAVPPRK
jgi:outer membrane protein assembly factor BamB/tetratricopeptide (TPR) repeat protein